MKKIILISFTIITVVLAGCGIRASSADDTVETAKPAISDSLDTETDIINESTPSPEIRSLDSCSSPKSHIIINEIRVSDLCLDYDKTNSSEDWVELYNSSDENLSTEGLYLTDNESELNKMILPSITLAPDTVYVFSLEFGLDPEGETLYLTDGKNILDYLSWTSFPYYCSVGRISGELSPAYFETPTPNQINIDGKHNISQMPEVSTPDGIFNDVETVEVVLEAAGDIYYTTDGSLPTSDSTLYESPIILDKTTTIRAVSIEDDAIRSFPLSLNYFINENFTLPVLSIVEDKSSIYTMREAAKESPIRKIESPGAVSLYDDNGCLFTTNCGLTLAGQASLTTGLYEKISFDVHFRSGYGQSKLGYDVFDTGFEDYSSLNIHAGQDSSYLLFDAEMWQDLCLEMCDNVYTQHSRFCIMYLNGEYWGIYCIKDDITKQGYADYADVKKSDVSVCESFREDDCDFCNDVYDYVMNNDMSDSENYSHLCEMVDMDNYMNWLIIQGISANSDLFSNIKIYRAADGKWQWALFDLDHAMLNPHNAWDLPLGDSFYNAYPNEYSQNYVNQLKQNDEFKKQLAEKYSKVYNNVLSNESILSRIDYYENLLQPEMQRDRDRWNYSLWQWDQDVSELRSTITDFDWQNYCVDKFCENLNIERADYFK